MNLVIPFALEVMVIEALLLLCGRLVKNAFVSILLIILFQTSDGNLALAQSASENALWLEHVHAATRDGNGSVFDLSYTVRHEPGKAKECTDVQVTIYHDSRLLCKRSLKDACHSQRLRGPYQASPVDGRPGVTISWSGNSSGQTVIYSPGVKSSCREQSKASTASNRNIEKTTIEPIIERTSSTGKVGATLKYTGDLDMKRNMRITIHRGSPSDGYFARCMITYDLIVPESKEPTEVEAVLVRDLNGDNEPDVCVLIHGDEWLAWMFKYNNVSERYSQSGPARLGTGDIPSLERLKEVFDRSNQAG